MKLLLEREDVNPDSHSMSGETPLSVAPKNGHEGIVKLLLGREDFNLNALNKISGQTLLLWAAENGHEEIVLRLLGREDIYPDWETKPGQTPLSVAAKSGHEGIVKLLLGLEF